MNVHTHSPLHTEGFAHPRSNLETLQIEPGMFVADFGAGSGHYAVEIARMLGNSGRLYAVEVQKDLLRRIHTEAVKHGLEDRIEFIWGDLEAPRGSKIADGRLDLVLVSNLLFQVPDKDAVLKEARRTLKATGELAIIDWSASFNSMGPRREDVVDRDKALALARKNGFELTGWFPAGAHHYGLLMRCLPNQQMHRIQPPRSELAEQSFHPEPAELPEHPEEPLPRESSEQHPEAQAQERPPQREESVQPAQASKRVYHISVETKP